MIYTWKKIREEHKYCKEKSLMTGLSFNDFIAHYYKYDSFLKCYIPIRSLGDE